MTIADSITPKQEGKSHNLDSTINLKRQMIVILDFGSQYSELIARRIRETEVYSEVISYRTSAEQLRQINPHGIILSGGLIPFMMRVRLFVTLKSGI